MDVLTEEAATHDPVHRVLLQGKHSETDSVLKAQTHTALCLHTDEPDRCDFQSEDV